MKQFAALSIVFAFVLALNVAFVTPAQAQSSSGSIATLTETLKNLLAKVADLQKQIADARGEIKDAQEDVREALKDGLKEGMTDEDIKKIQELLATDREIYPEGLTTGYFGRLTKEALKRFQAKHSLTQSGVIDEETKELLEEYFNERFDGNAPTGLWRAPGIVKKVHDRICDRSGKGGIFGGWGLFCKDWNDDDEDEDEDEDENEDEDDTTDYNVEVEVNDGESTVSFMYGGEDYTVVVESVRENRVLTAIARHLGKSLFRLPEAFKDEVKDKLADAIENEDVGSEEDADSAIDEAEELIDTVQTDIDSAEDDVDTDDAQEALDDASELLEEAQEAFDDDNFDDAEELAEQASDKAEEAEELLEDAVDDAD